MTDERKKTIASIVFSIVLAILTALIFCSCQQEDDETEIPVEHVLLVYMGGDNNLSSETYQKIEEIRKGWDAKLNHRLLIYTDPADTEPALKEIVNDKSGNILKTLSIYQEENSANSDVFKRVISDMLRLYPSSSYGMLVFSHASGWLPEGMLAKPKSVLQDNGSEMELSDFASAIPGGTFEYIVLETCFSAGIEVAYELKDKTNYILASSAEIVSPGFTPVYSRAINHLFDRTDGLEKFAQAAFNYFDSQNDYMNSATFSIIRTGELDNLAGFVKQYCDFETVTDINDIQHFDRYSYRLFFDFKDYHTRLLSSDSQREELSRLIDKCVIWKAATSSFMTGYNGFQIKEHSGMTTYIKQKRFPQLSEAYGATGWAKATIKGK